MLIFEKYIIIIVILKYVYVIRKENHIGMVIIPKSLLTISDDVRHF
jgi:hypothetical protein